MSNQDIQIRLEPKDANVVKIKASEESFSLHVSLRNTPFKTINWSVSCGEMQRTYLGGETILITIPAYLSGEFLFVVAWYFGSIGEKIGSITQISFFSNQLDVFKKTTLRKSFILQQEVDLQGVAWSDLRGDIISKSSYRELLRKGSIDIAVTGFNKRAIIYRFKFNGEEQGSQIEMITNNRVRFAFQPPLRHLQSDKIEIELIITEENPDDIKKTFSKKKSDFIKKIAIEESEVPFKQEDLEESIQEVVVGAILINENNFKPCKFTRVELVTKSEEPALLNNLFYIVKNQIGDFFQIESLKEIRAEKVENKITVFNESYSKPKVNGQKILYPVIAGKVKGVDLILYVYNFTKDKCKIHNYVITDDSKKIYLEKTSGENYEYRHALTYPYSDKFVPFDCIWPTFMGKKRELVLHSCRHSNIAVTEVVYPDIKWAFGFHIGAERHKTTRKFRMDCGFSFGAEWDDEQKDFSFAVKYPFNNIKKDVVDTIKGKAASEIKKAAIDFIDPIVNGKFYYFVTAISNLLRYIGNFLDAKEDMEKYYAEKNKFMKGFHARKTVTFQLKLPKLSVGASWVAATHEREIGVKLAMAIKGMVVGLKCTVDLYACMEKIPQVKAFIVGITWFLENFLNIETKFEIVFDGSINAGSDMSYNTASKKGKNEVFVEGKVDVSITLEASQETSRSATIETVGYGADGTSGIYVKLFLRKFAEGQEADTPKDGIYGDIKAGMKEIMCGVFKEETTKKSGSVSGQRTGDGKIRDKKYLFGGQKKLLDKVYFIGDEDKDFYRFFIR